MVLEKLKQEVFEANLMLPKEGLVKFTWGNVSGIDQESGLVVIKPSGIEYDEMTVDDMVIVDLQGNVVEGKLKPSSDTATHLVLYRDFENIGGVVHTHSCWATIYSQIGQPIAPYGTTHADYFGGIIPCTRDMLITEVEGDYEMETGNVIVECFKGLNLNPDHIPSVLVKNHGPFCWGESPKKAVENAIVLEEVAMMAWHTQMVTKGVMPDYLLHKHFYRKHGPDAYYGQQHNDEE